MKINRFNWMIVLSATMIMLAACTVQAPAPSMPSASNGEMTAAVPAAPGDGAGEPVQAVAAAATACTGQPTPAQMEGPYYTPNPPQRTSLIEEGVVGEPILLTGYVWDTACRPIAGAVVDLWQTDGVGVYDNDGYRLRGYTLTDDSGRYTMQTVVPGEYPGRPPHIHVKVQPPGGAVLTSQMYFPDAAANARDRLFDPALILDLQETGDGLIGVMNFVVTP